MEAGRSLDCLMAEKVMGLDVGWANFTQYHPGCYIEDFTEPWSKTKFINIFETPYQPRFLENGNRSCLDQNYQEYGYIKGSDLFPCFKVPDYSESISAAWAIVEKLGLCIGQNKVYEDKPKWVCFQDASDAESWLSYDTGPWTYADTAAHAICLCALKVMGIVNE